ncbi:hypothetical protein F3D3_4759 [Fusibacter sp. 3D3]|nr:hypothetical protein F3D3_4759 [Fusibacter sp. 3D3]
MSPYTLDPLSTSHIRSHYLHPLQRSLQVHNLYPCHLKQYSSLQRCNLSLQVYLCSQGLLRLHHCSTLNHPPAHYRRFYHCHHMSPYTLDPLSTSHIRSHYLHPLQRSLQVHNLYLSHLKQYSNLQSYDSPSQGYLCSQEPLQSHPQSKYFHQLGHSPLLNHSHYK